MRGPAPFGMMRQNGRLIPQPAEVLVVREMAEAFLASGGRMKATAQTLNEKAHRTRRGGPWTDTAVARVLDHEALRALLAEEIWIRCQAIVAAREDDPGRPSRRSVHPFGGVVRCSCGGCMYLRGSNSAAKYVCRTCRQKIGREALERVFEESLASIEISPREVVTACTDMPRAAELSKGIGPRPVLLSEVWPSLDASERRQVVELLISQLVVDRDEITILLAVSGDSTGESAILQADSSTSSRSLKPRRDRATKPDPEPGRGQEVGVQSVRTGGACVEPKAYRIQQVAELLSLPKSTVYDMVRTGALASVRTGTRSGLILIPATAVEEFLERKKAKR